MLIAVAVHLFAQVHIVQSGMTVCANSEHACRVMQVYACGRCMGSCAHTHVDNVYMTHMYISTCLSGLSLLGVELPARALAREHEGPPFALRCRYTQCVATHQHIRIHMYTHRYVC